ncbi:phosphatidylinositol N-acetylglucosaminyltransferase subunit P, putative [Plasmodium vinckei vinckei]|uniref:Phosphatidylinositol N-acetylglucosaminyltransferase subunit P, putative n=1 Tax=Plasmodium vinckei vinckei TaxID=54757 RepID=A0A449BRS9_PLAVN|nr:phosphatidylinositol N-acetylglucosaminyltransferase subunit P, putative [Plasmodium vinckei vinckei]VEV56176.1 phosphatidylinositol N-acetylglucosaminyltransferase subunit P, putative [Plasmodium vinckei vinckei]
MMKSIWEGYAFFILCLSQVLWASYLVWAFVFDDFLSILHFPFPSKYWAAIIPCSIVFTVEFIFLFTVLHSLLKTEPSNSIHLVEDDYSVFQTKITKESTNYMNDIEIEKINKLLYDTSLYID